MFEISSIPKIVIVKNGKYYNHNKKLKILEDFTAFINDGYLKSPALPLAERKTMLEKIWFLNKSALDVAIGYLDTFGLELLPYRFKVAIVLAVVLSPLIGVLIWLFGPGSGPKMTVEKRAEILAKSKERIRRMKTGEAESESEHSLKPKTD